MFFFSFLSYIITSASSVWLDNKVEDEEGTSNHLFMVDAELLEGQRAAMIDKKVCPVTINSVAHVQFTPGFLDSQSMT